MYVKCINWANAEWILPVMSYFYIDIGDNELQIIEKLNKRHTHYNKINNMFLVGNFMSTHL